MFAEMLPGKEAPVKNVKLSFLMKQLHREDKVEGIHLTEKNVGRKNMGEVRKVSISKVERDVSPNGMNMKEKSVCVEGDNFEDCKKEFDELWKT